MIAQRLATAAGMRAIRLLDAESAHRATINLLKTGLGPRVRLKPSPVLAINVAGMSIPNPLGLAAGFDKNAEVIAPLQRLGFGFIEVGAVTPRPQAGNEKPRVFRLSDDRAVINRYGFNNDGLEVIAERLSHRPKQGIVGINLGANKDSADRAGDYVAGVTALAPYVDFYTVNISSPNTPGLRALQGRAALDELLARVLMARDATAEARPVFLKIAPDLTDADKSDIAASVRASGIDGLIVSNTTITRPHSLKDEARTQAGGLSGAPLFELSTRVLGEFAKSLGRDVPLIGVGGVGNARQAYEKILHGASLVQLYTAMVFDGPLLPSRIVRQLPELLSADGFKSVSDAIGAKL